jgi:hypothetical protein
MAGCLRLFTIHNSVLNPELVAIAMQLSTAFLIHGIVGTLICLPVILST